MAAALGGHSSVMATFAFLLKRFFAQRLLGLATVVTLAFTVGVLVAGPIYAAAAREAILSSTFRSASVTVRNVRFSVNAGPDFAYRQADGEVRDATRDLPVDRTVSQGRSDARLSAGGRTESVPLLFRDGAAEHLPFKGTPPLGPGQVALPTAVAQLFGVRIGDAMQAIGPTGQRAVLTVTGTFGPPDPSDPFWFGSLIAFPSPDSSELPPALLGREGYLELAGRLGLSGQFDWDAYLDLTGLRYADAPHLVQGVAEAAQQLRQDPALQGLQVTTGLGTLLELVTQRVSNLQVPILLVVLQIGAVALAVLVGVGSLVLTRQSFELAVLRSRGFSGGRLIAGQGVQALLSAAAAFPLGLLFGMALAKLASRSNGPSLPGVLFPIHVTGGAALLGLAAAAVGAAALLLLSLPHVRRTILEERRLLSRESVPLLARYPVEAFLAPLGIFAFIELRNRGLVPTTQHEALDPLLLLAPTLLILALSFLALRLLLFALRRFDRRVGRTKSLPAYLAARRLGRSPGASFAISLLLVLSVGLLVVSTSYRAIVIRNHEDSAHQLVGADWRIEVSALPQPLAAIGKLPPGSTPVVRTVPSFERQANYSVTPTALGVDPATYATGGWWRSDYSATPEDVWLARLRVADAGADVGGGTLTFTVETPANAAGLRLIVTVQTPDGQVRPISLGPLAAGTGDYSATLPERSALLSIVLRQGQTGRPVAGTISLVVRRADVDGRSIDLSGWQALRWRGSDATIRAAGAGTDVTIAAGSGYVVGGIAPPMPPLPALVSPAIASSQPSTFAASLEGQLLEFRQVAVADSFPSVSGDFVVVSAPAMLEASARVPEPGVTLNEVWAMGANPGPTLQRAGFVRTGSAEAGRIIAILSQLPQSLAVGMNFTAAVSGLGLVVIGVAVGLYFAQRRREFEFASLRAMGSGPGQIARVLLLEQGLLLVFAVGAGTAVGFAMLRLVMPYVGESVGATFPAPVMVVDWTALGLSCLAIVVASAVGLLAALRALLRTSVTSVLRGEVE